MELWSDVVVELCGCGVVELWSYGCMGLLIC